MSFIDKSDKNVKRVMKEVTGGDVAGFTGRAGIGIDNMFAGPFHPEYMELEKTLEKQITDRKEKRKNLDSIEYGGESPLGGYLDINTEFSKLAYDELFNRAEFAKKYSEENTPILDDRWKSTGWDYDYDEPGEAYKQRVLKYDDNSYNNPVIKDIKYDDNSNLYTDDTYINKSTTNWKFINRR